MVVILGLIIVFASIIGGYIMEGGNPGLLVQPAELVIIFGAGLGAFIASGTGYALKLSMKSVGKAFMGKPVTANHYAEVLAAMYGLFVKIQRDGAISIEKDVESPTTSALFTRFPTLAKNPTACLFIGDTMRMFLTASSATDLDKMMVLDMKAMHNEQMLPAHSIGRMAEAMPGMGIVAAVLGVVLSMGKLTAPPEELGHSVGAALVGTFAGILLCYGIIGPIAAKLENQAMESNAYYNVIREAVGASMRGMSPLVAVEFGRRAVPFVYRPSFLDMEKKIKS